MKPELILGNAEDLWLYADDNSVDALVTDPPAGIYFMGKSWDGDKGGRDEWVKWMSEVMRGCYRVMKPGAHGLVWALPRTSHWTATALEDAGFEIRDCVSHLFGQGFPKSHDVSKNIDKTLGAKRDVIGQKQEHNIKGSGENSRLQTSGGKRESITLDITAPATPEAQQWAGWGTALKPAAEFWWLIRKPCSEKTVAANVLKWGTGGINIDGGRIAGAKGRCDSKQYNPGHLVGGDKATGRLIDNSQNPAKLQGRFPANLVLSCACDSDTQHDLECAVGRLDAQTKDTRAGKPNIGCTRRDDRGRTLTSYKGDSEPKAYATPDDGSEVSGASRFFYCAKISSGERGKENNHPTVKPQKLMRYLIRLITPPGGLVLDPFMGSGSTGVAAISEGFRFIGIEREAEYHAIARARMKS